jgi:hypothetical protein
MERGLVGADISHGACSRLPLRVRRPHPAQTGFFATLGRLGVLLPSPFLRWVEVAGAIFVASFWLLNTVVFIVSIAAGRLLVPPVRPKPTPPPKAADSMHWYDGETQSK